MAAFRSQTSWIGGISIRPIFQGIYKYLIKYQNWLTTKAENSDSQEDEKRQDPQPALKQTDSSQKVANQKKQPSAKASKQGGQDPEKGDELDSEPKLTITPPSQNQGLTPEYEERVFGSYIELYCEEFDIDSNSTSPASLKLQDIKVALTPENAQKFEVSKLGFANQLF